MYIIFFYYGITALFFIYTSVTFLHSGDDLAMHSNNFILCSAGGYKEECEVHREKAGRSFTATSVLVILFGISLSFLNWTHLLYVVNISKVIKTTRKYITTCCK